MAADKFAAQRLHRAFKDYQLLLFTAANSVRFPGFFCLAIERNRPARRLMLAILQINFSEVFGAQHDVAAIGPAIPMQSMRLHDEKGQEGQEGEGSILAGILQCDA